ncbi:hypothetical protein BC940DRAFT_306931 [Gongronella butleri]|nr:hypothetical protein BC940DRAFT_306931 [Gongronella butleri]
MCTGRIQSIAIGQALSRTLAWSLVQNAKKSRENKQSERRGRFCDKREGVIANARTTRHVDVSCQMRCLGGARHHGSQSQKCRIFVISPWFMGHGRSLRLQDCATQTLTNLVFFLFRDQIGCFWLFDANMCLFAFAPLHGSFLRDDGQFHALSSPERQAVRHGHRQKSPMGLDKC